MWAIRWSAAIRIRRSGVPEDRVRGAVARAVEDLQPAVAELHRLPVAERARHPAMRAPGAEAARHRLQCVDDVLGDAVAQHQVAGEGVLALGVLAEVGDPLDRDVDRRDLGPRVLGDDLDQAQVVDVLVGEDHQLEVVDAVAEGAELGVQLIEGLAGVRAGVDQGQRLVFEQVAIDPPDRERRRYPQLVDSRVACPLERLVGVHARISPRISSRFSSMCSRETSDSRLRRSSGSVFDGRTLKCQSG